MKLTPYVKMKVSLDKTCRVLGETLIFAGITEVSVVDL